MTRRLLFLCHANIARSAAAEVIARRLIAVAPRGAAMDAIGSAASVPGDDLADAVARWHTGSGSGEPWQVSSAGIAALVGHPIDPVIGDALRQRGISVWRHVASQATIADLQDADLILAFEGRHRSWALEQLPAARRKTLTIRRAATLVRAAAPGEGATALLDDAGAYGDADDFADPYGQGAAVAEVAVEQIDDLLRIVLPGIGAVVASQLPPKTVPHPTRRSRRGERPGDGSTAAQSRTMAEASATSWFGRSDVR